MHPYPVADILAQQRTDRLLAALADWRASTGAEHARDRRYALPMVQMARRERDARRAELRRAVEAAAAITRSAA